MVINGNYSIEQSKNIITIHLPQTKENIVDTVTPIANIKMLESNELAAILMLVKMYCELESEKE